MGRTDRATARRQPRPQPGGCSAPRPRPGSGVLAFRVCRFRYQCLHGLGVFVVSVWFCTRFDPQLGPSFWLGRLLLRWGQTQTQGAASQFDSGGWELNGCPRVCFFSIDTQSHRRSLRLGLKLTTFPSPNPLTWGAASQRSIIPGLGQTPELRKPASRCVSSLPLRQLEGGLERDVRDSARGVWAF